MGSTQKYISLLAALLVLTAVASAADLTGTVVNGTTSKPAAGAEVVVMSLSQGGMDETGRTRTDSGGRFTLPIANAQTPNLVRVVHQGVSYHKMAPPGTSSVELKVYDTAKKVDGITPTVEVHRYQTNGSSLEVLRLVAVKNTSNPPKTLAAERTLEISLPPDAQVDSAAVQSPGGQPITTSANPGEKGKYYFNSPLRPGETRFEIAYRLPYKGEAVIEPKFAARLEHFVVMLPKSMQFQAKAGNFQPLNDDSANVQVSSAVAPGQRLAFVVKGTGTLADSQPQGGQTAQGGTQGGAEMGGRPGGGLGAPSDLPDPLAKWRWYILGGFALVLSAGAVYVIRRPAAERVPPGRAAVPAQPAYNGNPTLAAFKEELFQLEVDRQQGTISAQEYAEAKAALDRTMKRVLARSKN
jgi:hypothetical protein